MSVLKEYKDGHWQPISYSKSYVINFSVILFANEWDNYEQIINDPRCISSGYTYYVTPSQNSRSEYLESEIMADDILNNNEITFKCNRIPSNNLIVNITRIKVEE